ncbi:MAG: MBL fold metallo-hydrolase, partial [Oscillospiraceae bacterium]|nr:MBL fold metallo-hydrolase [Oscillospiraceae bacterium]
FKKNIDKLYDSYADISSMNYYFAGWNDSGIRMERAKEKDFPPYVKHIGGQCNVVISKTGNAIAIDCGSAHVTDTLLNMKINVDALYITHYHDDHVDGCEYFRKHFDCPIYADEILADVLNNPDYYRLPAVSHVKMDVTPLTDGYTWSWQEFELTSMWFPGQTLYHDGLLLKSENESIFFAGDSFSPTGIDDYCAYNRNLFLPDEGYFRCINILRKYMPDYVINQHIMQAFTFTEEHLDYMETNLSDRIQILKDLVPWENINYALDPYFDMF